MELREILAVLWRRLWLIVVGALLLAAVAFAVSSSLAPVYRATVTMQVDQPSSAPLVYASIAAGEDLALTYSELLRTRTLLGMVIDSLGLETTPDALGEVVRTRLIPATPLLEISVEDGDPQRAADIANAIATTFIALRAQEGHPQHLAALEEETLAQMNALQALIARNQALVEASRQGPEGSAQDATPNPLEAALVSQQATYANLLSSYLSIQAAQAQFLDVNVVDPAAVPLKPVSPQTPLHVFLGGLLGLVSSAGAVFLTEYLDRSIKTAEDIRRALARPTLGIVPRFQSDAGAGTLVAWAEPYSATSEAFRTLRTNIRFASVHKALSALLVTSAEPGAGKTTVAANLGVVCAQAGLRVVLVDTDLRLPRLHSAFGVDNMTGLTDLLLSNSDDITPFAQETALENLRIISTGPLPPNPAELLGSRRMEVVLKMIRRQADLVIVDSPPVLPVTDAAVLAPKMDGVLLVVTVHKTPRDAARQALESLTQVGGEVVGAVLNGVPLPRAAFYRYYGGKSGEQRATATRGVLRTLRGRNRRRVIGEAPRTAPRGAVTRPVEPRAHASGDR
jgi:succinoglycan biosynthesis transport protein ExoP